MALCNSSSGVCSSAMHHSSNCPEKKNPITQDSITLWLPTQKIN